MIMKEKVQLTKLAPNCGCAAKVGPGTLAGVLGGLPKFCDPDLLVGTDTSDDAAVYRVSDDLALIQTLDFFTPVADDPYDFGQIAAANALSDVYAMGGTPKTALNIVAFPKDMDVEILGEILRGGADKVMEAGAVLAGGHTIQDDTPKYGLSVTGFVDPRKFWKNFGAQTGDKLILTKALGAGIVNTAIKAELVTEGARKAVLASMKKLNRDACEVFKEFEVHACTDVTGFGLGGHATEMAVASDRTVVIDTEKLPVLPDVEEFASMGLIPGGAYRNREFAEKTGVKSSAVLWREDLVFDPQTSGGLLAAVPERDVQEIMKRLEDRGVRMVVDAEKDLLLDVLPLKPFLIKPNNHELGQMFGRKLKTEDEIIECAKELQDRGAVNVLVSMAGDGALLVAEDGHIYKEGVCRGTVKNSVGAGDSMVAGFLAGYLEKGDYEYALKLGTASGGATAFSYGIGTKELIMELLGQLQ